MKSVPNRLVPEHCSQNRGFTLVELLVSMTIGTLLIVTVISSTVTITRTRARVEQRVARSEEARRGLAMIVSQLRNIRRDWSPDRPPLVGHGSSGGDDRIDLLVTSDDPARPEAPESDQYEVSFYLIRRPGIPWSTLVMRQDHELDEFPDDGGIETVVAEGITVLSFEYFTGEKWRSEWSKLEIRPPKAVRITVVAADLQPSEPGQAPRHVTLSTVVAIRLQQPRRRPQTGQPGQGQNQQPGGRPR